MSGAHGPQGGRARSLGWRLESPCGHQWDGTGQAHWWLSTWASVSLSMGHLCQPSHSPRMLPQLPHLFAEAPMHHAAKANQAWGAKGDGCSPAAVRSCLSFPAGGHLSRLCLSVELFNPLNLQPKHKGSFSRLCERACLPQTQLGFGGQEMQAAWEPDVGQGDSGRTSSFKQGAWRAFALGAGC